jgi:hypothetical protein
MSFVCIQCGATFERKTAPGMTPSLQKHWAANGHGPKNTQDIQIERAKSNLVKFPKR